MENTELVIDRQKKITELCNSLINVADGKDIIGNGENLITDAEFAKITHEFTDGIYMRRMDLHAEALIIGAVWKHEHFCFLLKGSITIADKYGVQDWVGPCYVKSLPGAQRVIIANEDSIFINVHKNPTNTRDMEEIEDYICSMNVEQYNEYIKNKKSWQE